MKPSFFPQHTVIHWMPDTAVHIGIVILVPCRLTAVQAGSGIKGGRYFLYGCQTLNHVVSISHGAPFDMTSRVAVSGFIHKSMAYA